MGSSTADLSVIVPCLNAEATLADALDSALNQTAPPREILLVDDGSRDRSVEIARSFGPVIRVLRNPSRGPGAARRIAVEQAQGRYIAFVDADDLLTGDKHERQLAVLESRGPHTLVHTGATVFTDDPAKTMPRQTGGELAVGRCTQLVFERNPVCGASTMLARSVILELGNYDADLFGTEDFGMSLAASTCCDFVHLPEPLYLIRRHQNNVTNRTAHMVYHHWLAQERFRRNFPAAFGRIPEASVRQFMIEPVLRAAREAYWRREPRDYRRLLQLALRLDPSDPGIRMLWRRRWCPLGLLRVWDRVGSRLRPESAGSAPQ
ncbi:MAG: hypothetical protein AMXMBFR13_34360 [Phycisphaerae bacterium]